MVRSVADDLRRRTAERVLEMSLDERLALTFALGDEDVALFARTSGLERDAARRVLRAQRSQGRALSVVNPGASS